MKRCGVYKYVYNGEIIYVGKSDSSIENRISGHSRESKFKPFLNKCEIYYAWLPNPAYTMIFETFLINKYKPHLNVSMKYDKILPFDIPEPYWQKYDKQLGCIYHTDDETKYSSDYANQNELLIKTQENTIKAIRQEYDDKIMEYDRQINDLKHSQSEIIDKLKCEYSIVSKQYEDRINNLVVLNQQSERKIESIDTDRQMYKRDCDMYKELYASANDLQHTFFSQYLDEANKALSCTKKINDLEAEVASLRQSLKNAKVSYNKALKNIKERDEKISQLDEKITQLREANSIVEQNKELPQKSFKSKIGRIFSFA